MYLSSWIALLLATCLPLTCGLTSFPKKMQVRRIDDSANLTCDTDFQGQVKWTHTISGQVKVVKESGFASINGQSLHLRRVDLPNAGEYSCWGKEKKLNQTYLFLKQEEDDEDKHIDDYGDSAEEKDFLSCSTQTYSHSFTCRLSATGFTAARLHHHRDGQEAGEWTPAAGQGLFDFTLPLCSSPFAEESAPIVVKVEAVSSRLYLEKTLRFYLRDIVKPDPPQSVKCERQGQTLSVTVQPPSSWTQPLSYFPLVHQIEFINKNNGEKERTDSGEITQKVSRLRARSRDPLVPSAWSEWSPWKNVTSQKNKRKDRGTRGGRVSLPLEGSSTVICKRKNKRRKMPKQRKQIS